MPAKKHRHNRLLIDGYNLLHTTDLFGQGDQAGTLRGARDALLDFLAARLTARERRWTAIVFDAAGAPPGLPSEQSHEGIRVFYARDFADADAMLESLIERSKAPKELLVVSGDHRVQRAARTSGAGWIDSSEWRRELMSRTPNPPAGAAEKPAPPDAIGDVDYWVSEFSTAESSTPKEVVSAKPVPEPPIPNAPETEETVDNPFPPGYAEDLAQELEHRRPRPRDKDSGGTG